MFLEVSAKTAHNVEESFSLSAKQILDNLSKSGGQENQGGMKLPEKPVNKKDKNCNC